MCFKYKIINSQLITYNYLEKRINMFVPTFISSDLILFIMED